MFIIAQPTALCCDQTLDIRVYAAKRRISEDGEVINVARETCI